MLPGVRVEVIATRGDIENANLIKADDVEAANGNGGAGRCRAVCGYPEASHRSGDWLAQPAHRGEATTLTGCETSKTGNLPAAF